MISQKQDIRIENQTVDSKDPRSKATTPMTGIRRGNLGESLGNQDIKEVKEKGNRRKTIVVGELKGLRNKGSKKGKKEEGPRSRRSSLRRQHTTTSKSQQGTAQDDEEEENPLLEHIT